MRSDIAGRIGKGSAFGGARPLKRTIQRLVQDPLARLVLASQVSDGDTVALTVRDGRLEIAPLVVAEPVEEQPLAG